MPFKSEKQRRWMWANEPEMAEKWEKEEDEKNEGNIMRISKRQLRRIIKEEAADCLKDYRLGGLTYQEYKDCLKRFEEIESQGGGYYPRYQRKTSYVGAAANQELIATIENVLTARPNNFLSSILNQLKRGRGLSGKQKAIVKKIIAKHDVEAAKLFERFKNDKDYKTKMTYRKLRRIIKEERLKLLNETLGGISGYGEPYLPKIMQAMADGDIDTAAQSILDNYGMDDTWAKEEMALEDLLSTLGPNPTPEAVEGAADEWYAGYKAGKYAPAPDEYETQWKLGSDRARGRGLTGAIVGETKITKRQLRRIIKEEKQRLLTETMLEWEDHPDIPDYIMGSVIPTLTEMVAAAGFVGNVSEDIVMDKLLDCMSAIAQELGVIAAVKSEVW